MWNSFVLVPPLFVHCKAILTVYLIEMIFDNFVNTNIYHGRQNISYQ